MTRDEALRILGEHREAIRAFGVSSLAIFGSVARDEAGPGSDVDVLVEFSRPVGLFEFVSLQAYLEGLLGCKVDLGTARSLKPRLRDGVIEDLVYVS